MNERIKEFADQAQQYAEYNTPQGLEWLPMFKERFAELIVRECVGIVADAVDHREPASTYVDKIKQHFGVEQ